MRVLLTILLQAPTEDHVLFASDKIFTVLGVMLIIWLGVLALMLRQQKKVSQLEKDIQVLEEQQNSN